MFEFRFQHRWALSPRSVHIYLSLNCQTIEFRVPILWRTSEETFLWNPIFAINRLFFILVANKMSCFEIEIFIMYDKYVGENTIQGVGFMIFLRQVNPFIGSPLDFGSNLIKNR